MLAFSRLSTRLRSCDSHSSLTSSPAYVSHLQSDVYVQSGVFFNPNTNDGASAKTHPICNSASDYSYGVDGVNACPSGKRAIESAIACSLFAFALGGLTVTSKTTGLHGCQVTAAGAVEFNSAAGAAMAGFRSVCTFVSTRAARATPRSRLSQSAKRQRTRSVSPGAGPLPTSPGPSTM